MQIWTCNFQSSSNFNSICNFHSSSNFNWNSARCSAQICKFFSSAHQNFFPLEMKKKIFPRRNVFLSAKNQNSTIASPDPISELEYEEIAEETLDSLTEYLEELGDTKNPHPDFDVNYRFPSKIFSSKNFSLKNFFPPKFTQNVAPGSMLIRNFFHFYIEKFL